MRHMTTQAFARISHMMLQGLLLWPLFFGVNEVGSAIASVLQVTPQSHDFGVVNRLGGEVQTTFMVQVQGDTPIKLRRIWTS